MRMRASVTSGSGLWRIGGGLALLGGAEALAQAARGWRYVEHTDYVAVATAGRVLNAGSSCIYCLPTEAAAQTALLGHPPDIGVMPYANPPLAAEALRPLAALPLQSSAGVFLLLSLVALAVAALLLVRGLLPAVPRGRGLVVAGCALTLGPAMSAFTYVQWDPVLVLAAAGALLLALRGEGLAAGAVLSLLLVKPQLAWLVIPALLIAGHRRILGGLLAGAGVWAVSTVVIVGVAGLGDWYRSNVQMDVGDSWKTAGVPGLLVQLTGRSGVAFPMAVMCGVVAVALLWRVRSRLRVDPALAIAAGLALSLLAAPHVFGADLLLLAPLVVLLARHRPTAAIAVAACLQLLELLWPTPAAAPAHALELAAVAWLIAASLSPVRPRAAEEVAGGLPRTLVRSA